MISPRLTPDPARPFQLAKFLSWTSLILIMGSSLFLAVVISNYAKDTILKKDQGFAKLLSENLNHQIYQRFTLPTVLGFGRVELKNKVQYERLDLVVRSTIHGFGVLLVKIYDLNGYVSYSTDEELVGSTIDKSTLDQVKKKGILYKVIKDPDVLLWPFKLRKRSYILKTVAPLRIERELFPKNAGEIIGFIEFHQDITEDYKRIYYFQLLITLVVFSSSIILFVLLYLVILRADKMLIERIKEKEELERVLFQNEKLASMGRMVATISHEIKNPLGIIQSTSEMLAKKLASENSSISKLARAIFEESQRLSRIVNDFLDYARPKEPKQMQVNLSEIINNCVRFLAHEGKKKGVKIEVNLPERLDFLGDKDLLYRGFYNIINNALEAVSEGGEIKIFFKDNDTIVIKDTGPGFEDSMIDKYLEPFFTTKDFGTGLGLPIAYNIFKSHGIDMSLASDNGGMVILKLKGEKK